MSFLSTSFTLSPWLTIMLEGNQNLVLLICSATSVKVFSVAAEPVSWASSGAAAAAMRPPSASAAIVLPVGFMVLLSDCGRLMLAAVGGPAWNAEAVGCKAAARCGRFAHLAVEGAGKLAPLRIVAPGLVRKVEVHAVEQALVVGFHLGRDIVERAADREGIEHFFGDFRGHPLPVAFGGLFVKPHRHVAPSVGVEHRLVGAGRTVEGDLAAHRFARVMQLFVIASDNDEGAGRNRDV